MKRFGYFDISEKVMIANHYSGNRVKLDVQSVMSELYIVEIETDKGINRQKLFKW
jgi:hypothetical protein